MEDINLFFKEIETKEIIREESEKLVKESKNGHFNLNGENKSFDGPTIPYFKSNFASQLEPNVRELVVYLNEKGFHTYTCCEGHHSDNSLYHVGIVFKNAKDSLERTKTLHKTFDSISNEVEKKFSGLFIGFMQHFLHDLKRDSYSPCLDIYLCKSQQLTWEGYYKLVNEASLHIAMRIKDVL